MLAKQYSQWRPFFSFFFLYKKFVHLFTSCFNYAVRQKDVWYIFFILNLALWRFLLFWKISLCKHKIFFYGNQSLTNYKNPCQLQKFMSNSSGHRCTDLHIRYFIKISIIRQYNYFVIYYLVIKGPCLLNTM